SLTDANLTWRWAASLQLQIIRNTNYKRVGALGGEWAQIATDSSGQRRHFRHYFCWRLIGKSDDERHHRNAGSRQARPMNRQRRSWKRASAGIGLGMLALAHPACAADLPLKSPALKA